MAKEKADRMVEHTDAYSVADRRIASSPRKTQEDLWVAASRQGDTQAFNRLVLKWEKTVYNIALRMLQDREEAAEATQDIFLRAYRNIQRFRRDARFSTWICRIAMNHCITCLRRRPPGIHQSLDGGGFEESAVQLQVSHTQIDTIIHSERQRRIYSALLHLAPEQRAAIELKFFQGMTFEDIAAVLETPLSTVKSRIYAGLEILKVRLADNA
ncbi:MAG: sigma-70 family RNA polymerase sigma factor [Acidobacteria bacterium]|nr:sigma-70 family RNA polymerase sigma factor [Acidobacteriota bacterium]